MAAVCKRYKVSVSQVLGRRRFKTVSEARQVCEYLFAVLLKKDAVQIGKYFNRDRTTIIRALKIMRQLMQVDAGTREKVSQIKNNLKFLT